MCGIVRDKQQGLGFHRCLPPVWRAPEFVPSAAASAAGCSAVSSLALVLPKSCVYFRPSKESSIQSCMDTQMHAQIISVGVLIFYFYFEKYKRYEARFL